MVSGFPIANLAKACIVRSIRFLGWFLFPLKTINLSFGIPSASRASSRGIGVNLDVSTPWGNTPSLLGWMLCLRIL